MLNAASYRRDRNPFVVAVYGAFDLDRDDGRVEAVANDAEIPEKMAVRETRRDGWDDSGAWEVALSHGRDGAVQVAICRGHGWCESHDLFDTNGRVVDNRVEQRHERVLVLVREEAAVDLGRELRAAPR